MKISEEATQAAKAHAIAAYPQEACGIIVDGQYVKIENISQEPEAGFEMDERTWQDYKVEAVIHSHSPKYKLEPSASDMLHQISSNVPWGIILSDGKEVSNILWWGDFVLDQPLVGRTFIHGVTDCYSAIRAWYWQNRQIKLKDFPRQDLWWKNSENLYVENFSKAGFREIEQSEATVGDVVLINFRSEVPNHGGVLIEDGLLYHHLQNRLSNREPIGRWNSLITKWLRYEG